MLSNFPVSGLPEGLSAPSLPPPRGFKPVEHAYDVVQLPRNPHPPSRTRSGAKLAGLRYEKKIKEHLTRTFGADAILAPWFSFSDGGKRRCCSPDALIRRGDHFVIVEIKIRHVVDSWWQLRHLYLPVLEQWRPMSQFRLLTIVGSYDPSTFYPEITPLVYDFAEIPEDRIAVMRLKK